MYCISSDGDYGCTAYLCTIYQIMGWYALCNVISFQCEQCDQGLHCLQFPLHLLDALLQGNAILFNF